METHSDENILETMPVLPLFIKMAVPAVLSQMINILYNLVDKMFIGHGLNAFITTQGYTKISMMNVAIGAVINVILDPVLIYGFHMGIRGAAIATVIAQGISAFAIIYFLTSEKSTIRLKRSYLRFDLPLIFPCLLLGASPALMQITENMVAISFNTVLQKYGVIWL